MGTKAIGWALEQPIKKSSLKFCLVIMANQANVDGMSFPSLKYIAQATAQDIKTVQKNILELVRLGYLVDTGTRKGRTNQVIVYRLSDPDKPVSDIPGIGCVSDSKNTGNGSVKDPRKRDASENERPPFFPSNTPVFPDKDPRFSGETPPKTGDGTIGEPLKEPLKEHKYKARDDLLFRGVDVQVVDDWLELRKEKKAKVTKTAIDGIAREAVKAGMSLNDALKICCERGWQGFNASWVIPKQGSQQETVGQRNARIRAACLGNIGDNAAMTIDMETL